METKNLIFAGVLLAVLYIVLSLSTITEAGLVWDETRYLASGKVRAYSIYTFLTGGEQLEICSLDNPPQDPDNIGRCWDGRPRFSQTVSGVVWAGLYALNGMQFTFWESVIAHRITTVLFAALAVFITFIFASKAFNPRVGIFSSLALIFMPRFFAHSQYATLDVPTASMTVLSMFVFWMGTKKKKYALLFGPIFGLAIATKMNAYMIIPAVILWAIVSYRDKLSSIPKYLTSKDFRKGPLPVLILSFLILTPVFMTLAWPWLWKNTPERYMDYVFRHGVKNVEQFGVDSCFLGTVPEDAPWSYPLVYLLYTLPTAIVLLTILGIYYSLKDTWTKKNRDSFLILSAVLVPFLVFTLPLSEPYNGVRLFLNFFPFIAILAGLGADRMLSLISRKPENIGFNKLVATLIALAIVLPGLYAILAPTVLPASYFNWIAGGTKGAFDDGLQVEYYGSSYLYAADWLNRNAPEGSVVHIPLAWNIFQTYKYGDIGLIGERLKEGRHFLGGVVDQDMFQQDGFLRKDIELTDDPNEADFIVVMVRSKCEGEYTDVMLEYYNNCEPVYSVKSDGQAVTSVYEADCL